MVQPVKLAANGLPLGPEALTSGERAVLLASVARGRAQYEAGEAISGEDVSRWLRSWGTDNELPPPERKRRSG